jgi:hypothetical protein
MDRLDSEAKGAVAGRRTSRVRTRIGSGFEMVGLGHGVSVVVVVVVVVVAVAVVVVDDAVLELETELELDSLKLKLDDFGESGGLGFGLGRNMDTGRLDEAPSARGEGLRGA